MANLIQNPYTIFTGTDGLPLQEGYVYIGSPGLNPLSNPLQAYWDAELTIPAVNIRTKNGYISRNGSPGRLYTGTNYSILVQDKRNATVFTQLDSVDYLNSASGSQIIAVDTIADLRLLSNSAANTQASVIGLATAGDGGMGPLYYWNDTSPLTDNGVSVIKPTLTSGNGRWLWVNTNAPMDEVVVAASGTLTLAFTNRIFLAGAATPLTLTVPDGDFAGQNIQIANTGASTVTAAGSGIPAGTLINGQISLYWINTSWSITYRGNTKITGTLDVSGASTVGGTLDVSGASTVGGTLGAGATSVSSLEVSGNTTLSGTLGAGATSVSSLGVSGNTTVGGTLGAGITTLSSLGVVGLSALATVTASGVITPSGGIKEANGSALRSKVIEIGDWNMDTTDSVAIAHGVTWTNIRRISALIRNDTGTINYEFTSFATLAAEDVTQNITADATSINLYRDPDGLFDSTFFDSTSYNRGWITIDFVV